MRDEEFTDVEIRYFDIDAKDALMGDALLPRDQMVDFKRRAVESLGITIGDGETPLQAWLRAMHEENGLEPQLPAHQLIVSAIRNSSGPSRFLWALA